MNVSVCDWQSVSMESNITGLYLPWPYRRAYWRCRSVCVDRSWSAATYIRQTHDNLKQKLSSRLGSRTLRPVNVPGLLVVSSNINNGIIWSNWSYSLIEIERMCSKTVQIRRSRHSSTSNDWKMVQDRDIHCIQKKKQPLLFSCITLRKNNQFVWKFNRK